MPGRFELPQPRMRDGWFRIKGLDITTTIVVVALAVLSMFVYAADQVTLFKGVLFGPLVNDGEVWRLVTWPLVNPPDSVFILFSLAFFWFVGHYAEEMLGKKKMAILLAVAAVLSGLVACIVAPNSTGSYGLHGANLAFLVVLALDRPNMPFFFGIPAWIMAAVYAALDVLRLTGDRLWGSLLVLVLFTVVCVLTFRANGHLADAQWIPKLPIPGTKPRSSRGRRSKPKGRAVVQGPWGETGFAPSTSTADQAELDMLLDKISASGMDSLSRAEKGRLNELSKRLRGG